MTTELLLFGKRVNGLEQFLMRAEERFQYEVVSWIFENEKELNLYPLKNRLFGKIEGRDSWKPTEKSKEFAYRAARALNWGEKIGNFHSHPVKDMEEEEKQHMPSDGRFFDLWWAKQLDEKIVGILTVDEIGPIRLTVTDTNGKVLAAHWFR
jgi:hypothetical protein